MLTLRDGSCRQLLQFQGQASLQVAPPIRILDAGPGEHCRFRLDLQKLTLLFDFKDAIRVLLALAHQQSVQFLVLIVQELLEALFSSRLLF